MFRPSGGHHQVVLLKLKLIQYVTEITIRSFAAIKQSCSVTFAKNETQVVCETPNVIRVIK